MFHFILQKCVLFILPEACILKWWTMSHPIPQSFSELLFTSFSMFKKKRMHGFLLKMSIIEQFNCCRFHIKYLGILIIHFLSLLITYWEHTVISAKYWLQLHGDWRVSFKYRKTIYNSFIWSMFEQLTKSAEEDIICPLEEKTDNF